MSISTLDKLVDLIEKRLQEGGEASYTRALADEGLKRVAQKVGEEGVEVALAALAGDNTELVAESSDLIYHLLVLLAMRRVPLTEVMAELERRMVK